MTKAAAPLLLLLCVSAANAEDLVRPLYARPATTTTSFNMDAFFEYFDGLQLQEAYELEGWTAGMDFTVPLSRSMQLRLLLPLRTDADAVLRSNGDTTDIEGWGGTFSFATLYFEHQLLGRDGGSNRVSYALGLGQRTSVLNTDTGDKYNHRGRSIHAALRYDRKLSSGGTLILDGEVRSYEESDDLNPGNLNDDRFLFSKVSGAWLLAPVGRLTPALELTADLSDNYTAVSLVPEIHLRTTQLLDLKLGVPVGLTADAPDWGTQVRLTVNL